MTLNIPFSQKSANRFCFVCSEHCLPGAVWEVENPGHGLIWSCYAGEAQRNGTTLCDEDPQQAEGQSGSGVTRITEGLGCLNALPSIFLVSLPTENRNVIDVNTALGRFYSFMHFVKGPSNTGEIIIWTHLCWKQGLVTVTEQRLSLRG